MSNFPSGCALVTYEVSSQSAGTLSLKGILMAKAINICEHCLNTKATGNELFCHPIIVGINPKVPMPFLVLVDELAVSVLEP